jgi:tungstate transport system ATP-binding protein
MSDRPICRMNGVAKGYGGPFRLLVDRLEVRSGEILCLLGPNGAGKSTLLRLLAGVERPDAGEVWLDGSRIDLPDVPPAVRRRITMVFQRPLMLDGTVRANLEYGLRLRRRDRRQPVENVLGRLGLGRIATQAARTTSGGQQQLVALARALAVEPDVLILDEPTASLDPAHVALVERVVADDNQRRGTTVIWATHNAFQARRVARRAGLLLDGRLVEASEVRAFFEAPSDPRTAAFVRGEMIY